MLRVLVAFFLIGLAGCGTTTRIQSWVDSRNARPIHHALVIAVVSRESDRVILESKLVAALRQAGVQATPSHAVAQVPHWDDRAALRALVDRVGADTVLIVTLQGVEEREIHHPPRTYVVPRSYGYYGYYHTVWEEVHEPGYTVRQTVVRLETNLYDVEREKLMWSGRSETVDPKSALDAMDSFVRVMIDDLRDKGLLPSSG